MECVTMWYVTMTDNFMSGWGEAEGKTNKLVFVCDTQHQARIVYENAQAREDMDKIDISTSKPYYDKKRFYTQFKDINEYPSWYKDGYFKKEGV